MKAENFFTQPEKEEISRTIKSLETRTSGEVAVILVDQSDPYPEGEFLGGILIGGLLALVREFFPYTWAQGTSKINSSRGFTLSYRYLYKNPHSIFQSIWRGSRLKAFSF